MQACDSVQHAALGCVYVGRGGVPDLSFTFFSFLSNISLVAYSSVGHMHVFPPGSYIYFSNWVPG